jgi:hypothetical protein
MKTKLIGAFIATVIIGGSTASPAVADPIDLEQLLRQFHSDVGLGPKYFFTQVTTDTISLRTDTGQSRLFSSRKDNPDNAIFVTNQGERTIFGASLDTLHGTGTPLDLVSDGSAAAWADRQTGDLHAKAGLNTEVISADAEEIGFPADATAWFGDTLFFTNPGASATTLTTVNFSMHVTGSLDNSLSGSSGMGYGLLGVWVGGGGQDWCDTGGFCSSASPNVVNPGNIFQKLQGSGVVAIDETYTASFSFLGPGAIVPILASLFTQGEYGMADFGDTATFSFDLPNGVSFDSASGDFLVGNSGSVPEPSTWAMMLIGFAGLGYAGFKTTRPRAST